MEHSWHVYTTDVNYHNLHYSRLGFLSNLIYTSNLKLVTLQLAFIVFPVAKIKWRRNKWRSEVERKEGEMSFSMEEQKKIRTEISRMAWVSYRTVHWHRTRMIRRNRRVWCTLKILLDKPNQAGNHRLWNRVWRLLSRSSEYTITTKFDQKGSLNVKCWTIEELLSGWSTVTFILRPCQCTGFERGLAYN